VLREKLCHVGCCEEPGANVCCRASGSPEAVERNTRDDALPS
jgi:hypothetical protein